MLIYEKLWWINQKSCYYLYKKNSTPLKVEICYTLCPEIKPLVWKKNCFRLTQLITLWNAEYEYIFIQKAYIKSRWLQNYEIELKFIFKNNHICSNTTRQTCTPLTNCFWKYPVIKIFPVTVLNFRVCEILLVRGVIKINNKLCTVYESGNYYNRLIIDMLIAKKHWLSFF